MKLTYLCLNWFLPSGLMYYVAYYVVCWLKIASNYRWRFCSSSDVLILVYASCLLYIRRETDFKRETSPQRKLLSHQILLNKKDLPAAFKLNACSLTHMPFTLCIFESCTFPRNILLLLFLSFSIFCY